MCTDYTSVYTLIPKRLWEMESESMLTPRGKNLLYRKLRGSNPRRRITQDNEPKTLPTELFPTFDGPCNERVLPWFSGPPSKVRGNDLCSTRPALAPFPVQPWKRLTSDGAECVYGLSKNMTPFWTETETATLFQQTKGWYHGDRRPSSDDSFQSPTVFPPSALDKPNIMKRYHRRRTARWGVTSRSLTMVTLHDTEFVECRWWNYGWTVKTVVTWRSSASMIPAPEHCRSWRMACRYGIR